MCVLMLRAESPANIWKLLVLIVNLSVSIEPHYSKTVKLVNFGEDRNTFTNLQISGVDFHRELRRGHPYLVP